MSAPDLRYGTAGSRWVLAAAVLGSGVAFLDGTVVNVALPAIGADLHAPLASLQWTVNAYLVTLSALLLLGGSLGDRYGRRRMFVTGLGAFTAASLLCGIAPSPGFLIAARAVQGVGGALLVPGSLAMIASTFHPDDRSRAIGAWSGLAGVASSVGPFLGGWLVDAVSWRLIFLMNVPLAAAAIAIALRHVPETRSAEQEPLDLVGAALVTVGLAGISFAAIRHEGTPTTVAAVVGAGALVAFVLVERSTAHPMLPLGLFRSRQFSGTNLTTFAVYAALSAAFFLFALRLQISLGYSALEAGASLAPFTVVMLAFSSSAGRLSRAVGARWPLTVGPMVAAAGTVLFGRIAPGDRYLSGVLPAVLVFGLGMSLTVAPLTAAVVGGVPETMAGVGSGVNNAVSRLAGLLAVAVLPAFTGIDTGGSLAAGLDTGYRTALYLAAGLCATGGVAAALVVRDAPPVDPVPRSAPFPACLDPTTGD